MRADTELKAKQSYEAPLIQSPLASTFFKEFSRTPTQQY